MNFRKKIKRKDERTVALFMKKVPFALIEVRLYQAYKIWTWSLSDTFRVLLVLVWVNCKDYFWMKRQTVQRRERIYERILRLEKIQKWKNPKFILKLKKKTIKKTQKTIYRSAAKDWNEMQSSFFFQKDFGFFFHLRELRQR